MKIVVTLFTIVLLVACNGSAPKEIDEPEMKNVAPVEIDGGTISIENVIKKVDSISVTIDENLNIYDTVHRVVFEYSTQGADLVGYFDKRDILKKVSLVLYGEYGKSEEYYYFDNGNVVLYNAINNKYKDNIYDQNIPEIISAQKETIFLNNGEIVAWKNSEKDFKKKDSVFSRLQRKFGSDFRAIRFVFC